MSLAPYRLIHELALCEFLVIITALIMVPKEIIREYLDLLIIVIYVCCGILGIIGLSNVECDETKQICTRTLTVFILVGITIYSYYTRTPLR